MEIDPFQRLVDLFERLLAKVGDAQQIVPGCNGASPGTVKIPFSSRQFVVRTDKPISAVLISSFARRSSASLPTLFIVEYG